MQIGFIGAGQMATALAKGFVAAGIVEGVNVSACDLSEKACANFSSIIAGAQTASDSKSILSAADVVFLAVKPQHMQSVFDAIAPVADDKLLVSIAAGIPLQKLAAGTSSQRIVRVMPNTPCLVAQGASGFSLGPQVTDEDALLVNRLLNSVGIAVQLPESLLDAVTGLSGSGPAFIYQIIEALSDAGVRVGLPRPTATLLATQTVLGSAEMVRQTGEHPAVLKDRVASPGGTTIAGLQALENGGLRAALISAVEAATNRSIELGR